MLMCKILLYCFFVIMQLYCYHFLLLMVFKISFCTSCTMQLFGETYQVGAGVEIIEYNNVDKDTCLYNCLIRSTCSYTEYRTGGRCKLYQSIDSHFDMLITLYSIYRKDCSDKKTMGTFERKYSGNLFSEMKVVVPVRTRARCADLCHTEGECSSFIYDNSILKCTFLREDAVSGDHFCSHTFQCFLKL